MEPVALRVHRAELAAVLDGHPRLDIGREVVAAGEVGAHDHGLDVGELALAHK
jgi:hypothetical protein